jgi:hypothetical protein
MGLSISAWRSFILHLVYDGSISDNGRAKCCFTAFQPTNTALTLTAATVDVGRANADGNAALASAFAGQYPYFNSYAHPRHADSSTDPRAHAHVSGGQFGWGIAKGVGLYLLCGAR